MEFGGWQFPDGEKHLVEWMGKSNNIVDGRLAYQYPKIELALSHVRQFRRAADVGAHIGLWSYHLADRFDRVDAFEPMPTHCECFIENVVAPNVTLYSCALGAADGSVSLTSYAGNSGHSHVAEGGEIKAAMRTLDSFGFIDLDFLKIDTEGYELEVLRGAVKTLKQCKPVIIVEQKANNGSRYGYDDRAALPFLHHLGARVVAERARDYVLIWPKNG
jgi:FkbM family methyltransferase